MTDRSPLGEPVVLLLPASMVVHCETLAEGVGTIVERLVAVALSSRGLFIFPSAAQARGYRTASIRISTHTLTQWAGMQSHAAAQVLFDALAETPLERVLMSDFRPAVDDIAQPFEVERLLPKAIPGFCGLLVPVSGQTSYAPGPQIAELCARLDCPLTVAVDAAAEEEHDANSFPNQLRLAARLGLPATPFAAVYEHGTSLRLLSFGR